MSIDHIVFSYGTNGNNIFNKAIGKAKGYLSIHDGVETWRSLQKDQGMSFQSAVRV